MSVEVTVHKTKHYFCWILITERILVLAACSGGSDVGRDIVSGILTFEEIYFRLHVQGS